MASEVNEGDNLGALLAYLLVAHGCMHTRIVYNLALAVKPHDLLADARCTPCLNLMLVPEDIWK